MWLSVQNEYILLQLSDLQLNYMKECYGVMTINENEVHVTAEHLYLDGYHTSHADQLSQFSDEL